MRVILMEVQYKLQTKEGTTDKLLKKFKQVIITGPVFQQPDFNKGLFLKTDWSKDAMGSVILQTVNTKKAEETLMSKISGGKCAFEKNCKWLTAPANCFHFPQVLRKRMRLSLTRG